MLFWNIDFSFMPEIKQEYEQMIEKLQIEKETRNAKIAKLHPNGECFPPHKECPACQRVFKYRIDKASALCDQRGLEATENNVQKILDELYSDLKPDDNQSITQENFK